MHASQKRREGEIRTGRLERGKQEEETKIFVFLFSISVTRVTPVLYVNMAMESLCPSLVPFQPPGLSSQ